MTTLINEMSINAPVEKIWGILASLDTLEKYDPTVKTSRAISADKTGVGAKRKVNMKDGKNWFEEKVTVWQPNEALTYQLTDCSFPINGLKHSYSFEQNGSGTIVKQVMEYSVKFGLLGKIMDVLMIRSQTEKGIKKFFAGLKEYAEIH